MLHLSSWMVTLPMMLIGMVGIILVIGIIRYAHPVHLCKLDLIAKISEHRSDDRCHDQIDAQRGS